MKHRLEFVRRHIYARTSRAVTIPIVLRHGRFAVELTGVVDTGCAHCVFERGQGEELGIEVESGEPLVFATAAGQVHTFGHDVEIETLGIRTEARVYFFANPHIAKNLLGRTGWLDRVRLAIVDYDQTLYLAPYD